MGRRTEEILRVGSIDELLDRGLKADEDGDIELAERLLDEAGGRAGENHPRVLHLAGRVAWAHGDIERAAGFLQQATDQGPDRAEIHLDCAYCLRILGEDGHAEEQVRAALALPGIDEIKRAEAAVLLSQLRLDDEDPAEALEVLEEVPEGFRDQAPYLGARADVLVELERAPEALRCLENAVAARPDEPDYHYQLGLVRMVTGDIPSGRESMVEVLRLENELRGELEAPSFEEVRELRSRLEEVFEELPDPMLHLVASAPITVQATATEEQVRAGADPRNAVFFIGKPKLEGRETEADLTGIVIARDLLVAEVEEDEEIDETLLLGLVAEMADFFDRDDLVFAEATT